MWGKGITFLREQEGPLPENMNRNISIELLKEHDMRCINTYFGKLSKNKTTYRHMWATGTQGPWNTDRYSELDLCRVLRRWANSIGNVEPDNLTNVNTDHLALRIKIKQKLKALAKAEHGKELRGAKSEGEQQTRDYNGIIRDSIREGKAEDVESFMRTLARAAEKETYTKTPQSKEKRLPPRIRKTSSM